MVCAVADRTLLLAGAGSSADSVLAARDQMERGGVSLLGVAFVEQPGRRRAEPGSDDRTATTKGLDETTPMPRVDPASRGVSRV